MSISFSRYVDITSGVGGASQIPARQLIGRIFTANTLVPPNTVLTFTAQQGGAAAVGSYFGQLNTPRSDNEYWRAVDYFGFVSKNIASPQALSFWYTNHNTATDPLIFGAPSADTTVADWTGITTGDFTLTMGAFTFHLTGLTFTGLTTLAQIAGVIQAAIRAETGGGALWTGATVSYTTSNPGGNGFNLVGGATGAAAISVVPGGTLDVSHMLGWGAGAILCPGTAAQSNAAAFTASVQTDNNFGSFVFTDDAAETVADHVAIASANAGFNNQFMYCTGPALGNTYWTPTAANTALIATPGVAMTLRPIMSEFPHELPMAILAATNYTLPNSVQNYMFQQASGLTPSVTDDTSANTYDALRINYYGQTQDNGANISFYQRGNLTGGATNPTGMGVYANEIWLKSAMQTAIGNLLLALPQVPANKTGILQLNSSTTPVIQQGLLNGTISPGKPLTQTQILYINDLSNTTNAWQQVQNQGYWINWSIASYVDSSNATEWMASYILIYSKDDVINFVQGTDILI